MDGCSVVLLRRCITRRRAPIHSWHTDTGSWKGRRNRSRRRGQHTNDCTATRGSICAKLTDRYRHATSVHRSLIPLNDAIGPCPNHFVLHRPSRDVLLLPRRDESVKVRLHFAAVCTTGCKNSNTLQPVVQPAGRCTTGSTRHVLNIHTIKNPVEFCRVM